MKPTTAPSSSIQPVAPDNIPLDTIHTTTAETRASSQDAESQNESPTNTTSALQPLELTPAIYLKLASATLAFFNTGINDGSLGALIPYILRTYSISTAWMALPYGIQFTGWLLAALFGGYIRVSLGTGGMLILGAFLQFASQAFRFWVPPFGLFGVTFLTVALGQALQDTQANTFVSSVRNAHRWLGVVHGCYALGGLVGPLIAAALASNFAGHWAKFYTVPLGVGFLNLVLCIYAFRDETPMYARFKRRDVYNLQTTGEVRRSAFAANELGATVKQKSVWLLSIFFFIYLGTAITAGGWVVEYLHVVRGGPLSQVGYMNAAFMGGMALGRVVLAEPTYRLGEKRMLLIYGVLSIGLQVVFWRVDIIAVGAVMISVMGFLLGPMFATGVSVGSKIIPRELHQPGLAMVFLVAHAGGSIFPGVTGVITSQAGVATLQPILVGLLAATAVAWFVVPDPKKVAQS